MEGRSSASRKCQRLIFLLSGELLACIFHIHALYKQLTRGDYSRKGKHPVPPVSAHLLWQPGDIRRPWVCVQTQQIAVDMERGSLGKEKSHLACSKETSPSGLGFHKVPGSLHAASFPFAGRGNNTMSRERDRAEVSRGSLQRSCSLAELIIC